MSVCHCITFWFVHSSVLMYRVFGGAYVIVCFHIRVIHLCYDDDNVVANVVLLSLY